MKKKYTETRNEKTCWRCGRHANLDAIDEGWTESRTFCDDCYVYYFNGCGYYIEGLEDPCIKSQKD